MRTQAHNVILCCLCKGKKCVNAIYVWNPDSRKELRISQLRIYTHADYYVFTAESVSGYSESDILKSVNAIGYLLNLLFFYPVLVFFISPFFVNCVFFLLACQLA